MFESIIAGVFKGLVGPLTDLGKAYINKQISEDEYRAQVAKVLAQAQADMWNALAAHMTAFQANYLNAMVKVVWMQRAHVIATFLSLFVFVWYLWIQPFGVAMAGCDPKDPAIFVTCKFPILRTGDTILLWNTALLFGLLGLSPLMFKDQLGGVTNTIGGWFNKK